MNCKKYKDQMLDLLLKSDATLVSRSVVVNPSLHGSELERHVAQCAHCHQELASLRATMALLDGWQVPEPSAYFDTRMAARLREERQAPPAGFLERARARILFSSNLHMRSLMAGAMAGALAIAVLIGGGTYDLYNGGGHASHAATQQASAAVSDLQSLDHNAQVIEQMDQLLQDGQKDDGGGHAGGSELNP